MNFNTDEKVFERVVTEAWNNPAYKEQLMKNPVGAIESLIGQKVSLPEGVERLVVADQSDPKATYFNIPPQTPEDAELTEAQLESVAGGVHGGIGGCIWPPIIKWPPFTIPIPTTQY